MSAEPTEEISPPRVKKDPAEPVTASGSDTKRTDNGAVFDDATRNGTTAKRDETSGHSDSGPPAIALSPAKIRMRSRLPALDDDADVGVQKEHIVTRDGKADLLFTGELLASAAPDSAPKGVWQEYRIYQTDGGKHVFSKVSRTMVEGQDDTSEAEVFDPAPTSVPSQLIRKSREIARARPLTWMDAAVAFFGYDPLAKVLYRKLGDRFEEHIA